MNLIKLNQKLISMLSFVDENSNEKKIANFIFDYLKQMSYLYVEKQFIESDRFNIFAKDSENPKIFFACHMDTVEPKQNWNYSQGEIRNGKLYGLGACDMKGGITCVLDMLNSFQKTKGLALLFYCDEEYDFKGIKEFAQKYSFKPDLIISPEATNLKIVNGWRGVIELYFRVRGKTGHASNPKKGGNAIDKITEIINSIRKEIKTYKNPYLGKPTLNLAFLQGGLLKKIENNNFFLGNRGNNIPDFAEAVIDIRTPSRELNAKKIVFFIKEFCNVRKINLEEIKIRSDLNPMITPKEKIKIFKNIKYGEIKKQPYFDIQILSDKFGSPAICLGPVGGNLHGGDEWVDIESLQKTSNIFKDIVSNFCT